MAVPALKKQSRAVLAIGVPAKLANRHLFFSRQRGHVNNVGPSQTAFGVFSWPRVNLLLPFPCVPVKPPYKRGEDNT